MLTDGGGRGVLACTRGLVVAAACLRCGEHAARRLQRGLVRLESGAGSGVLACGGEAALTRLEW